MMVRVLHIFGIMNYGGAEMRTVELMPLLAEKGVQFDYCVLKAGHGALDDKIARLGGTVIQCPLWPNPIGFCMRFVKILRRSNYDVVHSHAHYFNGLIMWLAYCGGVRSRIAHFRSMGDGKGARLHRRLYHGIMAALINRYATKILAVCRGAMEEAWSPGWRSDPRCEVVYNGLDLSPYKTAGNERQSVLEELGIGTNAKILINVGSINPAKGHDVLLKSFALIAGDYPEAALLLVGAARDEALSVQLHALAGQLGIADKVRFLGARDDVPRLLKASDCFILSSRREGLPGVVLEAAAAGLPVIATDLPGVREIAEHSPLVSIVPVESPEVIYSRAKHILDNPGECRNTVAEFPGIFDLRANAKRLYEIYLHQVSGA